MRRVIGWTVLAIVPAITAIVAIAVIVDPGQDMAFLSGILIGLVVGLYAMWLANLAS
jgi:hypothetical protein